jgi:PhnB protein
MTSICTFLNFNGNCRQAMMFYQKCLGGELRFQTVDDTPVTTAMPARMKKCILSAILQNGSLLLAGTDLAEGAGSVKSNSISLLLHCSSEKEIKELYKKLSAYGQKIQPLMPNFDNILTGVITDKFGINWVLQYKIPDSVSIQFSNNY